MEADLNADPTSQLVIQGEKRGTGHDGTCKCCDGKFTGDKRKLTVHIAGKNFLNDKEMGVRPCNSAVVIKQGGRLVPNTEQQPEVLLKSARLLLLKFIQRHDETTAQKQGLSIAVKVRVIQEKG